MLIYRIINQLVRWVNIINHLSINLLYKNFEIISMVIKKRKLYNVSHSADWIFIIEILI